MTIEEVLQQSIIDGNVVKLPDVKLDRKEYLKVAEKLNLIGGKWKGGKICGFVFEFDPTELLDKIINKATDNIKKDYQFFATPDKIAEYLIDLANINKNHTILEPSAGQGAIIKAIHRSNPDIIVDCYELMDINQVFLKKLKNINLLGDDFLHNNHIKKYDRIIANPPFSKNQDIDHVLEMYNILADRGRILTIVSKHWQLSQNKKETTFRDWLKKVNAHIIEIEKGEFKESGTMIETLILIIDK